MKRQLSIALTGALALGAATMASCSKEREIGGGQDPAEVRFTGNLAEIKTRVGGADGTDWHSGDPVGIYMLKADPGTLTDGNVHAHNKPHTASAGATAAFSPADGTPLYYPSDGGSVKFIAYHPHGTVTDYKLPVSVAVQTDLSAIDVLYSPVTTASYNRNTGAAVPLGFSHKLVKLVFNVSNDASVTEPVSGGVTVAISNQQTAGTLDLTDGTVTASGAAGALTATGAATIEAIVLPNKGNVETEFTFTNATGQSFTVAVPTEKWEGGYEYTYTVTLKGADKQADVTGEIDQWGDGGTETVTGSEPVSAWADETAKSLSFTASSDWMATVGESATRAGGSGVSWLTLTLDGEEAYSGGAGAVALVVELEPNYSGVARHALINIIDGSGRRVFRIVQAATTEAGEIPVDLAISLYLDEWYYKDNDYVAILSIHSDGIIVTEPDYSYKLGDLTWERAVNDIEAASGGLGLPDYSDRFPTGYKVTGTVSDITGDMLNPDGGPKRFTLYKPHYGFFGQDWATAEGDRAVLWVYIRDVGGALAFAQEDSHIGWILHYRSQYFPD